MDCDASCTTDCGVCKGHYMRAVALFACIEPDIAFSDMPRSIRNRFIRRAMNGE